MSEPFDFDDELTEQGIAASGIDGPSAEDAVLKLIHALGENPDREGLKYTPKRVAGMYAELLEALVGAFRVEELARVEAKAGQPEVALDQLEMLLARPSVLCAWSVQLDPAWDPLRSQPRFRALLQRHGVTP